MSKNNIKKNMFKLLRWFNFRLGVVGYMVSSTQLGGTLSDDKQKCQTKTEINY